MKDARSRLILALDVPDRNAAIGVLDRLAGQVGCFKVGLELFVREGPRLVEEIRSRGENVFLDLKLHDIPNTVAGAVRSACSLGVQMLTLHSSGGREMLEAAAAAAGESASPPLLLAVTALTSMSPEAVRDIGIAEPVPEWVDRLAEIARRSGVHGLVASALELPSLRRRFGRALQIVVPGIRPAGTEGQDQCRTARPADAILGGADFLVVGRPILRARDPAGAARAILQEIGDALLRSGLSEKS